MNKTYSLFACCIPINGYRRSIVLDIQRETFSFIPNVLYEILKSKKIINEKKLIKEFCENDEDIVIIKEYLSFLIENEFLINTYLPSLKEYHHLRYHHMYIH